MSKDLGMAGGKAPSPNFDPLAGKVPTTGFDSAPKGEISNFEPLHGHGGSNSGAH